MFQIPNATRLFEENSSEHNQESNHFRLVFYIDQKMPLKSIANERQLHVAQKMINKLLSKPLDLGGEEYLDALTDLVEKYETDHHNFRAATASQVLEFLLDERGLSQYRVAIDAGVPKSTMSDILSGKRSVTIAVAKKLGRYFGIAPSIFIDCDNDKDGP